MEKVLEFVSNNYIWFIVVGGILLIIALILLFVKKDPVKVEKTESVKPKENIDDIQIEEEVKIDEEPSTIEEVTIPTETKVEMPNNVDPQFSVETVMDAPIKNDAQDVTETLDIIDDSETNSFPNPEVQTENNVGEVNIPSEVVNTDNANSTSDDDIWKF